MAIELFADNATTTLASSPSAGATSFTVASSSGFPAAVSGTSQFRVLIGTEVVTVTNVSGTTWTCVALAQGHSSGDAVSQVVTSAGLQNLSVGGGDCFRSGYYSHGLFTSEAPATLSMTQNRLYARPFFVPVRRAFDRLGINISTAAGTSGVLRLGIYADGGGVPGALIVDAGTVSATTTGTVEITIAQTLNPGLCWLALVSQGSATAATVTAYGSRTNIPFSTWNHVSTTPPTSTGFGGPFKDTVSGSLPDPFGTITSAVSSLPMIAMRAT